jgi:dTDP-4-amino-4,6-dideoxy-D-glucose ammonia-lyase
MKSLNINSNAIINFSDQTIADNIKKIITTELILFFQDNKEIEKQITKQLTQKETVNNIYKILDIFSSKPLTNYHDISKILSIYNKDILKIHLLLIKNIKVFQDIIINRGQGKKYWINIIIPLIKSHSIQNFIKKKYAFPFRIGLFPGVSCMFECSFCGRNYSAVYKKEFAEKGLKVFEKIIDEAPKDDQSRFFLSGGLEPLTNPYLSSIIDYLKLKNFKASLYTNGYMLTEKYLRKNPSIFSLDSLRISFYGVNDSETFSVTKKKQAFKIVTNNIVNFLKIKDEIGSKTSFGLNFVILKNKSNDVVELFKLVSDLNKSVGNNKNNFDFITLREDFRILGNRMDDNEKNELIKNINVIEEMRENDNYLKNIHIDYGFALEPLKNGFNGNKIESSFATLEDLKLLALPQGRLVVDLYGDVYLFGEAGFLDRPGAKKYILGNLFEKKTMKKVVEDFIDRPNSIDIKEEDRDFLDAWDHVAIKLSQQQKMNSEFGIGLDDGFINMETINDILKSNHKVHFSS